MAKIEKLLFRFITFVMIFMLIITGISKMEARNPINNRCGERILANPKFCERRGRCESICSRTRNSTYKFGRCIGQTVGKNTTYICHCRNCPWP
ncbi:unnamed protein product [Arabidopsis halleri]